MTLVLAHDAVYPRDEAHRYRLYALEADGGLAVRACAATAAAVGVALVTTAQEHLDAGGRPELLAVYDAIDGKWLSTLWAGRG